MTQTANLPLNDHELEELDFRLARFPEAMSLEAIDGLFCALIVGPVAVPPSDWLAEVLGEQPADVGEADVRRLIGLLIRHWNHVASGFRTDWSGVTAEEGAEAMYFPLLAESEDEDPDHHQAQAWAEGFRIGLAWLEDSHIEQIETDEECRTILTLIAALDSGEKDDGNLLTEKERDDLIPPLTAALQYLYVFWRERSGAQAVPQTPFRAPDLPGRNDLCPCGSGKKFKKCCGAPERLH
jgi:uncharacterized protein